jgi:NAD(P)-dependent dehydrogenase (short-subunit alcohol dehydrogenase family)
VPIYGQWEGFLLEGKVVIITGSAGGIGRYTAKTFAQERAKVVIADIKPLDTVAAELAAMEVDYLALPANVRDEEAVKSLMDQVMARFGRIDVLHNNAAVVTHFQWGPDRWPRIRDMDKGFFDRVIDTSLGGTFLCTKHVLPIMEAQHSGHIINMLGGASPESIGSLAYMTAKDAVRTFTRFVAEEERESNVCIVGMGPGATIATEEAPEEARARMPGVDVVGNRFVLAAEAPMEMSGKMLDVKDGKLVARP